MRPDFRRLASSTLKLRDLHWRLKQRLAEPSRYYGDGGTIHRTGQLNVELREGEVVGVWFRCQFLPFDQTEVSQERAAELTSMYESGVPELTGVEVKDR